MHDLPDRPGIIAARLLKGAALLFSALGVSFLVWVGAQWVEFPEARASQFGFQAPLWPALGLFVIIAMAAVVTLFWSAARRVERGEPLYRRRHRRRDDWENASNGTTGDDSNR